MISTFVETLLILRIRWPFSVTSWGRTVYHNQEVGGVADSHHLRWLGMDVVLDGVKRDSLFEKDCDRMGIRALWEDDHYHLQPKDLPHIL